MEDVQAMMEDLGLHILGECTRPEPIYIEGVGRIWPSAYGKYDEVCDGCSGHEPESKKVEKPTCGNCKWWKALPKNDIDSYE